MSYSNPHTVTYTTGAINTTTGGATLPIRGPKGRTGRLIDVIGRCTTSIVLGGTHAKLDVGVAGTTTAYGTLIPAAMVAPLAVSLTDLPGISAHPDVIIPANTQVILTTTATGSGSGTITYDVVIAWF